MELSRAVPLAMVAGPETALAEIEKLERDGWLSGYQYLPAIKAGLLSRPGGTGRSADACRQALALAASQAERAPLAGQIADHALPASGLPVPADGHVPPCSAARHEAHADGCVLVSADDDLALTLGENRPAERLRPEPGQPRQVVSVNDDVMESDRHAVSMRGHAGLHPRELASFLPRLGRASWVWR